MQGEAQRQLGEHGEQKHAVARPEFREQEPPTGSQAEQQGTASSGKTRGSSGGESNSW